MSYPENFPQILAVAAIVIDETGNILLRKRTKEPDQGKWEYIAGYVKPGERLEDTVRRKLKEKVGITEVQSIEFTGKYYDDPNRHPGTYCIPLVFIVRVQQNNVTIAPDTRWFSPTEARELEMALDNKQILQDLDLV